MLSREGRPTVVGGQGLPDRNIRTTTSTPTSRPAVLAAFVPPVKYMSPMWRSLRTKRVKDRTGHHALPPMSPQVAHQSEIPIHLRAPQHPSLPRLRPSWLAMATIVL